MEAEARRPGRSWRGRWSAAVGAVLAALALAELAARVLVEPRPPLRLQRFAEALDAKYGLRFEEVFRRDAELFWSLAPSTELPPDARPLCGLIANAQGLREDHPIAERKAEGELRLLFLGDSSTFGYGVGAGETFVERTEGLLAERFPALRIECINAGVPGYTLFQGWRWLVTRGLSLEPDLLVVDFGWNESARWGGAGDLGTYEAWRAARPPAWLAWSSLAAWAWSRNALDADEVAGAAERPRLLPGEFRRLLELCARAADERGAGLLVLVGPGRANVEPAPGGSGRTALQAEKLAFARGRRIGPDGGRPEPGEEPAAVDGVAVAQALAAEHGPDELFFDGVHPTAVLHRALARALAERLGPWIEARTGAHAAPAGEDG